MGKHEHTAALGLSHFWPSAVRTLHDVCNRRQNKYLLSQHAPDPSCSRKTNKHRLKLGRSARSTEEFRILLNLFSMRSVVQSKGSILLGKRKYWGNTFRESGHLWKGLASSYSCVCFQTQAALTDLHFACRSLFYRLVATTLCYQTAVLVYCSHAHLNPNAIQPNPKVLCVPGTEDKKGKKRSTSLTDIRTKTNLEENCSGGPGLLTPEIPLMWLKPACQPNLIWLYIQRKCLV